MEGRLGELVLVIRRALLAVALLCFPRAAWPQGPLGQEFRVNTYTTNEQNFPLVASDSSGNFVVVWSSDAQDGSGLGVFGRRFSSAGVPLGPEFRVNTYTTGAQDYPSAASDSSGNFVVVWQDDDAQDGSGRGIFGQRYAATGAPLGPEFRVNTVTLGDQRDASVASDAVGNFVIVWSGSASADVFGQRYSITGTPLGPEFLVNTYTTGVQQAPSVASDSSGNFVVVWEDTLQDGDGLGIFGQRFANTGAPLGPEFRVNTITTGLQDSAIVGADLAGNFVVAWHIGTPSFDIAAQRYASSGTPVGPQFQVNTYTTSVQYHASVAMDSLGQFVVAWDSYTQDGSNTGVYGQRYASSGVPLGPEFQVNTYTTNRQYRPSVGSDSSGNFVVVWASQVQDGSLGGVFGQLFGQPKISVGNTAVQEGNVGATTAVFGVTLSGASASPVSVDYATADGTATVADADYVAESGTVSFAPGQTLRPLGVTVTGDTQFEPNQTFLVNLTNPQGAPLADGLGVGTIVNDDAATAADSRVELVHGSRLRRSLDAVGSVAYDDFFRISEGPRSSWEVVVDATTGDLGSNGPALERIASDGFTVLQSSLPIGAGFSRSLSFENMSASATNEFVRVRSLGCGANCGPADIYRLRAYETTLTVARFNNSSTQFTVLLVQNTSDHGISGTLWFRDLDGALLGSEPLALAPRATQVLNTAPVAPGASGTISISHDGRYGDLAGKAVAVEPATGFTFDTPLEPRPR